MRISSTQVLTDDGGLVFKTPPSVGKTVITPVLEDWISNCQPVSPPVTAYPSHRRDVKKRRKLNRLARQARRRNR